MRTTRDLTDRQFRWGMLAAYILHLTILGLYVFDVIPQEYHGGRWHFRFHHGGDEDLYFDLAQGLLTGSLPVSRFPIGFPLLLAPFVAIFQPRSAAELLEVVSAFWAIVMFPIGQWTLAWISREVTGRRLLAILSVLLWTSLPLAVYGCARFVGTPVFAETNSVHLTWAQMMSDGPATLFALLTIAAFIRGRQQAERTKWWLLLGALGGSLMLIRLTGALTLAVVVVLLLAEQRWRATAIVAATWCVVFSPQLIYNFRYYGGPLTTGYHAGTASPLLEAFSLVHLIQGSTELWNRMGLLMPLTALGFLVIGGVGSWFLWRRDRIQALAVDLWLVSHLAFFTVLHAAWQGSMARYLMPAYPAAAVLAAGAVGWLTSQRPGAEGS